MSKKLIVWISAVLLIAALVGLGIFAYANDGDEKAAPLPLNGVWRVLSYVDNGNVTMIESEFMVFGDETAADYRGDLETPFVESPYSYDGETVDLPKLGRKYTVIRETERVMQLHVNREIYMELVRYSDGVMAQPKAEQKNIIGAWDVSYRWGFKTIGEEKLVFDEKTLSDYRGGSAEPGVVTDYIWNDNGELTVNLLGQTFLTYVIGDNELVFVEKATGHVWDLVRVAE